MPQAVGYLQQYALSTVAAAKEFLTNPTTPDVIAPVRGAKSAHAMLLATAVVVVAWVVLDPVARFRCRHIPGPFGWPLIGNLVPFLTKGIHVYFMELTKKYGSVFKVWRGGGIWIVVTDPGAIKKNMGSKMMERVEVDLMSTKEIHNIMIHQNLFTCKADLWKLLKKAWDPAALVRSSLDGYSPLMIECAQHFSLELENFVDKPDGVDVYDLVGCMTLDVVGTCAFGVELEPYKRDQPINNSGPYTELLPAVREIFISMATDTASRWNLLNLAVPKLKPLWTALACWFPDTRQRKMLKAFDVMHKVCLKIIDASRKQRMRQEEETPSTPDKLEGSLGIKPGSFVALLESWRSKNPDVNISDDLLVAQVFVFLLAGYDTTATTLAFAIHFLATNPHAVKRLTEELEQVLGGRAPSVDETLDKLPYLEAIIKETLRLKPASTYIWRGNSPDGIELCGYQVPKGSNVLGFLYAYQHDAANWKDPEAFLPERFLPGSEGRLGPFSELAWSPFGVGTRKCLGQKFAMLELMTALAVIFQKYHFSPHPSYKMNLKNFFLLTPANGIQLTVRKRT